MKQYSIGIDYGTLSARALLIDIHTGEELAVSTYDYTHGVMEDCLPCGKKLGDNWALQNPQDYLDALYASVRGVLAQSGVSPEDVVGIGVDFTSCTILPTKKDGTPLCLLPEYAEEPHAYVKLWKHHAAQYCADKLNRIAEERGEGWLALYGGKISSEWMIPKIMQIASEAPNIYAQSDRILEAGDWLVWQLTGKESRSACNAGYKGLWHYKNGYPSREFFGALNPLLENVEAEKLTASVLPLGSCAGYLTREMAQKTGLCEGTAVATEIIDAHASVPACKIGGSKKMLMIIGTSTCHMLLNDEERGVPGTCGIVKDGILPGFFGYEAGQSCVGDHFSWFVENCVPAAYFDDAKAKGMGIHAYLRGKAQRLRPGESGLLALDWWNGVRSVLMDFDLTGLIVGMNLQTKPEEIYRALIEATAYGTRQIIEAFEAGGVAVEELYAAGGIAVKDPMMMQIYADICGREIKISGSEQSGALGSAMFGAAAAPAALTGYADINEIAGAIGKVREAEYRPVAAHTAVYDRLFAEYKTLNQYFGCGGNDIMKRLKKLRREAVSAVEKEQK